MSEVLPVQELPCAVTHCIKETELGRLEAKIENDEKTNAEIKEAIFRLVETHNRDKQTLAEQYSHMTNQITRMSEAMTQSAESGKILLENQNRMLGQLQAMLVENQNISNKQTNVEQQLTKQAELSDLRYGKTKDKIEDLGKRLSVLETHRHTLLSIGALIVSMLTAAGMIAQIFDVFKK